MKDVTAFFIRRPRDSVAELKGLHANRALLIFIVVERPFIVGLRRIV
jgi:hypothetical protein